jgi:DNA-binding XRE family transcriptional regulator
MIDAKQTISEVVSEIRVKTNLTQDDFGKLFGVSGPAIYKIEKGKMVPSFHLWLSICEAGNISKPFAVRLWAIAQVPLEYQELVSASN